MGQTIVPAIERWLLYRGENL